MYYRNANKHSVTFGCVTINWGGSWVNAPFAQTKQHTHSYTHLQMKSALRSKCSSSSSSSTGTRLRTRDSEVYICHFVAASDPIHLGTYCQNALAFASLQPPQTQQCCRIFPCTASSPANAECGMDGVAPATIAAGSLCVPSSTTTFALHFRPYICIKYWYLHFDIRVIDTANSVHSSTHTTFGDTGHCCNVFKRQLDG